jgi:hypothetical protein
MLKSIMLSNLADETREQACTPIHESQPPLLLNNLGISKFCKVEGEFEPPHAEIAPDAGRANPYASIHT